MSLIVYTTTSSKRDAEKLAEKIVLSKLGACIQVSKINSYYKWKGKIEKVTEFKLEIKTSDRKYKELERFIIKNHSYELPEIIAVKINKGYSKYLGWLKKLK